MSEKILFMLSRVQLVLISYVKQELKKQGIVLSPGQIGILFVLDREKQTTMGLLSQALEMDNAATSRLVDKLERQSLVERFINPDDRRQINIKITGQGQVQAAIAKKIARLMNGKIQEGFSPEELDTYNRINQSILSKFTTR